MKRLRTLVISCLITLCITSCGSVMKPKGWPVAATPSADSVAHMMRHVRLTGTESDLTKQEKALLTFLNDDANIAAAIGKKNTPGSHIWSAAEVYRVEPGKHISVLCENGYNQDSLYFHYDADKQTWFRVNHLGENHSKGIAAVIVQ